VLLDAWSSPVDLDGVVPVAHVGVQVLQQVAEPVVGQVQRAVPDVAVEQVLHAGPVRREQLLPAGQQGLGDRVAGALRVGEQVGQRRAGGGVALVGSAQLQLVDDCPRGVWATRSSSSCTVVSGPLGVGARKSGV